ncbi:MAG: hypothetical protein S0880_10590 [Actinomycetota bacterium]|nr:hypothetical protein [Actinomycetota bacterium]
MATSFAADEPSASAAPSLSTGPGSLAAAIQPLTVPAGMVDRNWVVFHSLTPDPPECERGDPLAVVASGYSRPEDARSVDIRVELHTDAVAAREQLELLRVDETCAEAELARANAGDDGLGEVSSDAPAGVLVEPYLADVRSSDARTSDDENRDAASLDEHHTFTRAYTGELEGTPISGAVSAYVDGRVVVEIDVGTLSDERDGSADHVALTREIRRLQSAVEVPDEPEADPLVDDAVDRLRSVLSAAPPAPRFELSHAVVVQPAGRYADGCSPAPAPLAEVLGPGWTGVGGQSLLVRTAHVTEDEAAASALVSALAGDGTACSGTGPLDGVPGAWTDAAAGSGSTEVVDGREVALVRRTVRRDDAPDVEWTEMSTAAAVGAEVVGWRFFGPLGDEPDLVALTAAVAADLDGG